MKILVLHRFPIARAKYDISINHLEHEVYYLANQKFCDDVPSTIRCTKILLEENADILETITKYIEANNIQFDRVIALSEYNILTGALIRDKFKIHGSSLAQIRRTCNKNEMKHFIVNSEIRTAKYCSLEEYLKNPKIFNGMAIVLKIINGTASKDVTIFKDGIIPSSFKIPETGSFIVEEFLDGDILHIDGLVQNGNLICAIASKYIGTCLAYAEGEPLASIQIETSQKMVDLTKNILQALKIENGSFHLELINHNNDLYFLEIANRAGGSHIVEIFQEKTGVHLYTAETQIYIDNKPKLNLITNDKYYGWFLFPGHHLKQKSFKVNNYEKFIQNPIIQEWKLLEKSEAIIQDVAYRLNEQPFGGILKSHDSESMINFIDTMFNEITVEAQN
jgi:hypothetical protein